MKRFFSSAAIAAAVLTLGGCMTAGPGQSVSPSALAPTGGDVPTSGLLAPLQGGLVGRVDGLRLTRDELIEALETEYRALEYTAPGDIVAWQGSGTGLSGQVVASQPYRVGSQDCRQYTHTLTAPGVGAPQTARGTACRNPDGSWALLS